MKILKTLFPFLLIILLLSCEEEVEFDLDFQESLVVQGSIEPMMPAYVILTKTQSYFSEINPSTYENSFVSNAEIWIRKGNNQEKKLLNSVEINTIYPGLDLPSCFYAEDPINPIADGPGTYHLKIIYNNDTITSVTTIPNSEVLDSVWFEVDPLSNSDSLGYVWAKVTDPDTLGNNVMIRHKRIYHNKKITLYKQNDSVIYINQPDSFFISTLWGSVRSDFEGLNGNSFVTYFARGNSFLGHQDPPEEYGYFKIGDTVMLKFSQIDEASAKFWRQVEAQGWANQDPFSEPMNLTGNVNGALGIWSGYGAKYYKVPIYENTTITNNLPINSLSVFDIL